MSSVSTAVIVLGVVGLTAIMGVVVAAFGTLMPDDSMSAVVGKGAPLSVAILGGLGMLAWIAYETAIGFADTLFAIVVAAIATAVAGYTITQVASE